MKQDAAFILQKKKSFVSERRTRGKVQKLKTWQCIIRLWLSRMSLLVTRAAAGNTAWYCEYHTPAEAKSGKKFRSALTCICYGKRDAEDNLVYKDKATHRGLCVGCIAKHCRD